MGERLTFKQIFADVTRKATKIPAGRYQTTGRYPIIDQSVNAIAGYTDSLDGIYADAPAIVFGDHTCAVKYGNEPFFIGADGTKVLKQVRADDDPRYLFHALRFVHLPDEGYTRHFKWLKECSFNIPEAREQHRIARILDSVQDQIAFVVQMLTKADELVQSRFVAMFDGVSHKPLSELCNFYSGGTPSKKKPEYWTGSLPWFSPKDLKHPVLADSIDHIHDSVISQTSLKLLPAETVVIVVRGMILAHDVPVAILKVPSAINQDLKALMPKEQCNPIFLAEAVRNQESLLLAETGSSAHGTKKIDTAVLGSVPIPAVDIALQNEFAEFVTRVESMKSDLTAQRDRLTTLYDSLAQRYFAD